MKITNNRKRLVGATVIILDGTYYMFLIATIDQVPLALKILHLVGYFFGGALLILGVREEEKKHKLHTKNSMPAISETL